MCDVGWGIWKDSDVCYSARASQLQHATRLQQHRSIPSAHGTRCGQSPRRMRNIGTGSSKNLLILTETGRLADVVTGEAPIERSRPFPQTEQRSQPEPKRRRMERQWEQAPKTHREANGQYTFNRRGKPLCMDFQSGGCVSGSGVSCSRNPNMTHQCAKCLGDRHGAHICNMTPREPCSQKGKGTGKNKN